MNDRRDPAVKSEIRGMFGNIARRYDIMNSLMTFGRDHAWRRYVIEMTGLASGGRLLDVGAGTGKIALDAIAVTPDIAVVAADFSCEMMRVGKKSPGGLGIHWCCADALQLPFPDSLFHAVTSGYLVRNVTDIEKAFEEQLRVVVPGGRVVCLDTSPAPHNILQPFALFYLRYVIPLIGWLITGDSNAYRYLPESTQAFKTPEELAGIMEKVGFREVVIQRFMFGNIGVVTGRRPRVELNSERIKKQTSSLTIEDSPKTCCGELQ
jgi:demethylmenaquinone methyltransferase/2-methoxy-6-polyprenyl-1,4-benzoquinol methylase